jgi:class 3 adenylate cyclase
VSQIVDKTLKAGLEAARRHAWQEAFDLLSQADATAALPPENLETLAYAAWWTGRLEACISARERAFAARLAADHPRQAAVVAMALAKDHYAKGSPAIGTAWVKRAERLLADQPECVEQGYLERLRAVMAHDARGDYESALEHSRRALELGTRFGDRELQAIALHDQGRALAASGDVDEGFALMDEATAAAVSGELGPFNTAVIYCNTITACSELADYRRGGDWSEAAKRWCERQAITGFPGMCRVYRASIMLIRGEWPEAELEARRACDELQEFNVSYAAEAFYELGQIRARAGDVVGAEESFKHAHELGREPQPGLARLLLADGKIAAARACIDQALEDESRDLHRARLLPAKVEIAIAAGDLVHARAATDELDGIARRYGSEALEAGARSGRSKLALADEAADSAAREARQALRLWQGIEAPYEAAESRMLLASAYVAQGNLDGAMLELEAASAAFDRLGASLDARAARERLESLGGRVAAGARVARVAKTFMFTDIVRSTNLVEAIGDEAWADLVAWHDHTLRSLFAAHQGEEVDHAGDGFFVAFADAPTAVGCAVAIQRRLAAHRREHGFSPQVRIGLHAVEVGRRGAGYSGKGIHEAARISALADGGEILASAHSLRDGPLSYPVSEPRSLTLKGVAKPVDVVSIEWS